MVRFHTDTQNLNYNNQNMYELQLFVAVLITAVIGGLTLLTIGEYLICDMPKHTRIKIGKYGLNTACLVLGFILSYSQAKQLISQDEQNEAVVVVCEANTASKPVMAEQSAQVIKFNTLKGVSADSGRDIVRVINGDINSTVGNINKFAILLPKEETYDKYTNMLRLPHSTQIKGTMSLLIKPNQAVVLIGHEEGRYIDTG